MAACKECGKDAVSQPNRTCIPCGLAKTIRDQLPEEDLDFEDIIPQVVQMPKIGGDVQPQTIIATTVLNSALFEIVNSLLETLVKTLAHVPDTNKMDALQYCVDRLTELRRRTTAKIGKEKEKGKK